MRDSSTCRCNHLCCSDLLLASSCSRIETSITGLISSTVVLFVSFESTVVLSASLVDHAPALPRMKTVATKSNKALSSNVIVRRLIYKRFMTCVLLMIDGLDMLTFIKALLLPFISFFTNIPKFLLYSKLYFLFDRASTRVFSLVTVYFIGGSFKTAEINFRHIFSSLYLRNLNAK